MKVPILVGVRLSVEPCSKTQEEEEGMSSVPYSSVVGSLMYSMVCTRPDIAHAVGVFEKVYVKTKKGALDSCKEGVQVFVWDYRSCNLLQRKRWTR